MKLLPLLFLILFYACGPNAAEVAEQIRIQDSTKAAKLDSVATERKVNELKAKYVAVDTSKNELQKRFDSALTSLDSLTGYSNDLDKYNDQLAAIAKIKTQIASILKEQILTDEQKREANILIDGLNNKVDGLIKSTRIK